MRIVTGPGRSGTSLAARLLIACGADFGSSENHIPGDPNNPEGYFEDIEFVSLNTALLLGVRDDARRIVLNEPKSFTERLLFPLIRIGYLFPPSPRRLDTRAAALADRIEATAERLSHSFVKCTRIPACFAAWADRARIDAVLFIFRHPAAVARSTKRAYGLPIPLGLRLWRLRVARFLDVAAERKDIKVFYVDFDRLCRQETRDTEIAKILTFGGFDASSNELIERCRHLIRLTDSPEDKDAGRIRDTAREHERLRTLASQQNAI